MRHLACYEILCEKPLFTLLMLGGNKQLFNKKKKPLEKIITRSSVTRENNIVMVAKF